MPTVVGVMSYHASTASSALPTFVSEWAAKNAALMLPIDVAAMMCVGSCASWNASKTPASYAPRAPPPLSTTPRRCLWRVHSLTVSEDSDERNLCRSSSKRLRDAARSGLALVWVTIDYEDSY